MGQSSSTQREQRQHNPATPLIRSRRSISRNRDEEMSNGQRTEHTGDLGPQIGQESDSNDVQMSMSGEAAPSFDPWHSMMTQPGDTSRNSRHMGSIQEETGSQHEPGSRGEYRSVTMSRIPARRQSTMSRFGSRILPNNVIRGLLNSEEETPAEGHAHRHGIVSRTIPRSEVNHTSSRFSPFMSLSTRGATRRRSIRGPYFANPHPGYSGASSGATAENPAELGWAPWRRSVRLRRVGHSLSNPIAQMFGQPNTNLSPEETAENLYQFHNSDSIGFIPHPGPMDTRMDFDRPHELDSVEPATGNPQPTPPILPQSAQNQSSTRHFPSLLRTRPSRALRREEQTPLSRVLQLAAAAIAAQLSGGTGPALPNIQALGNDGLDGSLESFIQSLQRATSGQPAPGDAPNATEDEGPPTPVNFMRVFRFANSDTPRPSDPTNRSATDSGNAATNGDSMETDNHTDGPEGRTVTLVIVGVRSVPSGNGPASDQQPAALPGIDALLRLPFLTPGGFSPRLGARPGTAAGRPSPGSAPTTEDAPSQPGLSNPSRRLSDAGSRGAPSSLPSVISESPPGPHPPPSTPAEPGLSAVSSGASTPSRRLSTTSAIPPNFQNENRPMQPTVESPEDGIPPHTTHQRRRSDSEFARHREQLGSGAARRNGVVEPDSHGPPSGRSWLIYVVGTNLSENHPAFAAPSLFTDNPTYEDMVLLSSLLGPVKPPVATQEDLTSAGGLFRVVEYGGSLVAEGMDGSGTIRISEGERCLICLSDYEAAEELRQLTKCQHLYHRDCIDQVPRFYFYGLEFSTALILSNFYYLFTFLFFTTDIHCCIALFWFWSSGSADQPIDSPRVTKRWRTRRNMDPIRLTVLISGSGTNLQAVIDNTSLPTKIIRVISNRKDAFGLERAKRAGIPTHYHNLVKYKKQQPATPEGVQRAREEYDAELARLVLDDKPDLVACLGFMHVLSEGFLGPLEEKGLRIINLHPALPGEFNGANAIERAHQAWLEGKIEKTGVMIHNVISEVDMGKPILVREIPFLKGVDEDLHAFEQKVHEIEWGVVIEGIQKTIEEIRGTRS
ncbi:formyl transferase-domain-containing protein [Aspergillus granulosus]|uniref:phosphoribosylglycinamide formyltransferase 1 n=1 Tax=Aspergillus granulosus TaxID=176169 RepID=A0ABR4HJQ7_9EURO